MIFHQGRYYRLQVKNESGELLPASLLLKTITDILNDPKPAEQPLLPGLLTSLPRREWFDLRNSLMALNPDNKSNLNQIESALAVFAIDETLPAGEADFFGRVFCSDPGNRWYDKSLQFVLNYQGNVGINYEHSGVDGTTLGKLVGYLFDGMEPPDRTSLPEAAEETAEGTENIVQEMSFSLDSSLEEAIRKADRLHQKMGQGLSFQTLAFTDFGKDTIKGMGVSPDSFIQLGIQLAQHKAFQKVSTAYESVMTKQFRYGRTETMRPVTWESLAFVTGPSSETLKAASLKHVERINACKSGSGIDRHFFALSKMYEQLHPDSPLPELFRSPEYKAVTRNTFSTSTSNSHGMRFAGYGPSVGDGFAVRYLIFNDRLHFVLSSCQEYSDALLRYKDSLQQAYREMAKLRCQAGSL